MARLLALRTNPAHIRTPPRVYRRLQGPFIEAWPRAAGLRQQLGRFAAAVALLPFYFSCPASTHLSPLCRPRSIEPPASPPPLEFAPPRVLPCRAASETSLRRCSIPYAWSCGCANVRVTFSLRQFYPWSSGGSSILRRRSHSTADPPLSWSELFPTRPTVIKPSCHLRCHVLSVGVLNLA